MTPDRVLFARLSSVPLAAPDAEDAVRTDADGAVVSFVGVVRDHDGGHGVRWLDYSAHPTAQTVIAEVAAAATELFPSVRVAVEHRTGRLAIGDIALSCAVASAHRQEAFAACAHLVDEVKRLVPIWKEQGLGDGTTEWVGLPG